MMLVPTELSLWLLDATEAIPPPAAWINKETTSAVMKNKNTTLASKLNIVSRE